MSAPKVTDDVLAHPDVVEKRKTFLAAAGDWLEQIAHTSLDEQVGDPQVLPVEYVNEWVERLQEIADPAGVVEQDVFYAMFEDLQEWRENNQAASRRAAA